MRSIMDTKKHPDYSDAYQKIYGSLEEKKSGMSSDAMSSILKGNRYSGKELFNMSKKSTQQGRHGEAHALYKEFQKKKAQAKKEAKKGEVEVKKKEKQAKTKKRSLAPPEPMLGKTNGRLGRGSSETDSNCCDAGGKFLHTSLILESRHVQG